MAELQTMMKSKAHFAGEVDAVQRGRVQQLAQRAAQLVRLVRLRNKIQDFSRSLHVGMWCVRPSMRLPIESCTQYRKQHLLCCDTGCN